METSIDPRIRPSLIDLAPRNPPHRTPPTGNPRLGREAAEASPGGDPSSDRAREAFAHYRTTGTDEVTTLGPDREIKTAEAPLRFGDLVDLVNPLQHIPVVSSLYRTITGDEIAPAARIFGSLMYTGPLGFVYATVDSLFAEISGKPFGDTLVSAVFGGGEADQPETSDLAEPPKPPAPEAEDGSKSKEEPQQADRLGPATDALTGNAALRALAADLQLFAHSTSSGHRESDAAEPGQSGKPGFAQGERILQSSAATRAAAAIPLASRDGDLPATGRAPELNEALSRKMTEALDKYRAMAEARRREEERSSGAANPSAELP